MATNAVDNLLRRIERLPVSSGELGIDLELALLQDSMDRGHVDVALFDIVQDRVLSLETALERIPFLPPTSQLHGDVHLADTLEGQPVGLNIGTDVQHVLFAGAVASGKTTAAASLSLNLLPFAHVVLIDSHNVYRKITAIRDQFDFVRIRDVRLNPFDEIPNLPMFEQKQVIVKGLAESYDMKLSEQEVQLTIEELLTKYGKVNLPSLLHYLRLQRYPPGSNRGRFRDTAVLHFNDLLEGVHPCFECEKGMDLFEILTRGGVVLLLDSVLPIHQAYLVRLIFDYCFLLHRSGRHFDRPLVVVIDEALLLLKHAELSDRLLHLRHSQCHLVLCVQHPYLVPPQILGNTDCQLAFALQDGRDVRQISQVMHLNREQEQYLTTQDRGHAICFLPRSKVKDAFAVKIPRLQVDEVAPVVETAAFIRELSWEPIKGNGKSQDAKSGSGLLDEIEERFLRDVLNQEAFEFSSLTHRFERCALRSASKQGSSLRKLTGLGYISIDSLAIGKGRPLKLVEPTKKLLDMYKVNWKKGKGKLATRAAQEFFYRKMNRLRNWRSEKEGKLCCGDESKLVDVLSFGPNNEIVTGEIANSLGHETHNALFCLSAPGVVRHVVVTLTQKACKDLTKKFSEVPKLRDDRVEITVLSRVLKDDWVPLV